MAALARASASLALQLLLRSSFCPSANWKGFCGIHSMGEQVAVIGELIQLYKQASAVLSPFSQTLALLAARFKRAAKALALHL